MYIQKLQRLQKFLSITSIMVLGSSFLPVLSVHSSGHNIQISNTMSSSNPRNSNLRVCINQKLKTQQPFHIQPGGAPMKVTVPSLDQEYTIKIIDPSYGAAFPIASAPIALNHFICNESEYPVLAQATVVPKSTHKQAIQVNVVGNAQPNNKEPVIFSSPVNISTINEAGGTGVILGYHKSLCLNGENTARTSERGRFDLNPGTYEVSYPSLVDSSCGNNPKHTITVQESKYTLVKFKGTKNPEYQVNGVSLEVIEPVETTLIAAENIGEGTCTPDPVVPDKEDVDCVFPLKGIKNGYELPPKGIVAQVAGGPRVAPKGKCQVVTLSPGNYQLECKKLSTCGFEDYKLDKANVHVITDYKGIVTPDSIRSQVKFRPPASPPPRSSSSSSSSQAVSSARSNSSVSANSSTRSSSASSSRNSSTSSSLVASSVSSSNFSRNSSLNSSLNSNSSRNSSISVGNFSSSISSISNSIPSSISSSRAYVSRSAGFPVDPNTSSSQSSQTNSSRSSSQNQSQIISSSTSAQSSMSSSNSSQNQNTASSSSTSSQIISASSSSSLSASNSSVFSSSTSSSASSSLASSSIPSQSSHSNQSAQSSQDNSQVNSQNSTQNSSQSSEIISSSSTLSQANSSSFQSNSSSVSSVQSSQNSSQNSSLSSSSSVSQNNSQSQSFSSNSSLESSSISNSSTTSVSNSTSHSSSDFSSNSSLNSSLNSSSNSSLNSSSSIQFSLNTDSVASSSVSANNSQSQNFSEQNSVSENNFSSANSQSSNFSQSNSLSSSANSSRRTVYIGTNFNQSPLQTNSSSSADNSQDQQVSAVNLDSDNSNSANNSSSNLEQSSEQNQQNSDSQAKPIYILNYGQEGEEKPNQQATSQSENNSQSIQENNLPNTLKNDQESNQEDNSKNIFVVDLSQLEEQEENLQTQEDSEPKKQAKVLGVIEIIKPFPSAKGGLIRTGGADKQTPKKGQKFINFINSFLHQSKETPKK